MADEQDPVEPTEDDSRLRRFARRILDRKELAEDTKDLLSGMLATSDKAKSDFIRMMGREVGHWLDGLNLKNDLLDVATNYKLEVHATFHLSPIAKAMAEAEGEEGVEEEEPG
ncbi:MAG: hypothetical protein KC656_18155 [Myxococcales bacterium]|nr:hypothetical protein [Myxococcales bacterium]MCB9668011.1 hypothetical protein [Alphaproteobacteria bacterium]MCB9693488.1 hypothetical protein [Alphaproteobacteria bacterium]